MKITRHECHYYDNGKLSLELFFEDGQQGRKEGPCAIHYDVEGRVTWEEYRENGQVVMTRGFYPNQRLKRERRYSNGVLHHDYLPAERIWNENGDLVQERFWTRGTIAVAPEGHQRPGPRWDHIAVCLAPLHGQEISIAGVRYQLVKVDEPSG